MNAFEKKNGNATIAQFILETLTLTASAKIKGTQREYSSKPLKHSIGERILLFKR